MDGQRTVIDNGAVGVKGERIVAVGAAADLKRRFTAKQTIDAGGMLVIPGLINTHGHAPMALFRGIADDLTLMEWLNRYIFPAEKKNVDEAFVRWGTKLACAEMLKSGTTTYVDMYYFEEAVAEETKLAGMRAVLGETIIDFPSPDHKTVEAALEYTEKFLKRWRGDSLITAAVAPHSPYLCSVKTLTACRALADKYEAPLLIHLSETRAEVEQVRERYQATSTEHLEKIGLLKGRVLGAHGVWLSDNDIRILKAKQVGIAHCPESNMKLASGVAPVIRMRQAGVAVGLGTDGAASNNDLDMFQEMDTAAKLHKLYNNDPTALRAADVLEMATIAGARSLGMDKEIGSLEPGKRADLLLVSLDHPNEIPFYNAYSHLVYAIKGAEVSDSIINGKVVMKARKLLTLDEKTIYRKAREYRDRILQSLK
ncbi:MAG: amidohydrolase [Acidobacteria bacterium]|nr:amidohydrolase [Acidobacteriota bacterium]MBI3657296.1 amidohydrolase [Acidobacteriota bacterium]